MNTNQSNKVNTELEFQNQVTRQLLEQASKVPENPFDKINFLSRILFFWITPLLNKACKRNLTQEDIFDLRKKDSCEHNFKKFNKVYEQIKDDPKISNKIRETFFRVYKSSININYLSLLIIGLCREKQPLLIDSIS